MRRKKTTEPDDPDAPKPSHLPPDDFCEWWYPAKVDPISGASVGGHPDADRTWARKEPGRWNRRSYGINALTAWSCVIYREEFHAWIAAGRPQKEPFLSLVASPEKQKQFAAELRQILSKGKSINERSIDF